MAPASATWVALMSVLAVPAANALVASRLYVPRAQGFRMSITSGPRSTSPSLRPARRQALQQIASAGGLLLAPGRSRALECKPGECAGSFEVERVVPLNELTAGLATAPRRTVVITGSNSGVGLAGAKLLTAAGHTVICACRNQAKAEAAAAACNSYAAGQNGIRSGGSASGAVCDLSSFASIKQFSQALGDTAVDSLVLNAGLSLKAGAKGNEAAERTVEGFELTVGTNHVGHFLLANLLVDRLAKGTNPRLVITASGVHDPRTGDPGLQASLGDLSGLSSSEFFMVDGGDYDAGKAYKDSKLCNVMFMQEASRRFKDKGIAVNAFSPGFIPNAAGFFRYQDPLAAKALSFVGRTIGFTETNEFGGTALAFLATDSAVAVDTGSWFDAYPAGKHQLAVHDVSPEAADVAKQRRLWELSAKLTGIAA